MQYNAKTFLLLGLLLLLGTLLIVGVSVYVENNSEATTENPPVKLNTNHFSKYRSAPMSNSEETHSANMNTHEVELGREEQTAAVQSDPSPCLGKTVILEMGEVRLEVERRYQTISTSDGIKDYRLDRFSDEKICDEILHNVTTYRTGELTLGVRPDKSVGTSYSNALEMFERHKAVLDRSTDENSVENIKILGADEPLNLPSEGAASEYFIIPGEVAATDSDEPILYTCNIYSESGSTPNGWCKSSFYHVTGLFVHHRFPRLEPSSGYVLEQHKKLTEWISNAIMN